VAGWRLRRQAGAPAGVRVLLVALGEQALGLGQLHAARRARLALREAVLAYARQLRQDHLRRGSAASWRYVRAAQRACARHAPQPARRARRPGRATGAAAQAAGSGAAGRRAAASAPPARRALCLPPRWRRPRAAPRTCRSAQTRPASRAAAGLSSRCCSCWAGYGHNEVNAAPALCLCSERAGARIRVVERRVAPAADAEEALVQRAVPHGRAQVRAVVRLAAARARSAPGTLGGCSRHAHGRIAAASAAARWHGRGGTHALLGAPVGARHAHGRRQQPARRHADMGAAAHTRPGEGRFRARRRAQAG